MKQACLDSYKHYLSMLTENITIRNNDSDPDPDQIVTWGEFSDMVASRDA